MKGGGEGEREGESALAFKGVSSLPSFQLKRRMGGGKEEEEEERSKEGSVTTNERRKEVPSLLSAAE